MKVKLFENVELELFDDSFIIHYIDGLNIKKTLLSLTNFSNKETVLLKTKKLCFSLLKSVFSETSLSKKSVYDLFLLSQEEKSLFLSLVKQHIEKQANLNDISLEKQEINIFEETDNLKPLQKFFFNQDKDVFNVQNKLDLFSFKNWIYSKETLNSPSSLQKIIPFKFVKKADFNLFKNLNSDIINMLISFNDYYTKDNHISPIYNKLSIFIELLSYCKNHTPFFDIENKNKDILKHYLFVLYYLLDYINPFLKEIEFKDYQKHVFPMLKSCFLITTKELTFLFEDKYHNNEEEIKKEIPIILSHFSLFSTFSHLSLLFKKFDCETSFKKINNLSLITSFSSLSKKLQVLSNEILLIKKELYFFKDGIFYNYHINDKPFVIDNFIFYPLIEEIDFYNESDFMNNCMKSKFNYYNTKFSFLNNINLYFHVIELPKNQVESIIYQNDDLLSLKHSKRKGFTHFSLNISASLKADEVKRLSLIFLDKTSNYQFFNLLDLKKYSFFPSFKCTEIKRKNNVIVDDIKRDEIFSLLQKFMNF